MVWPRKRQMQRCLMVDDERWAAANEVAKAQGISLSEFIRRSMDEGIAEAKRLSDELEKTWNG